MSESIQELRLDTPGFSPKKIINSTLANGFQVKEQRNICDFNTSPEKILKKQNGTAGSHLNNNNVKTTKNRNTNTVSNGIGSISEEVQIKSKEKKSNLKLQKTVAEVHQSKKIMLNVESTTSPIDPKLITDSIIKGAIPILSHKTAALCLVLNCLCPGSGTLLSGFLVLACCRCSSPATVGCPRWHADSDTFDRVCCVLVNLVICLAQMITVPLCLVGWCWSVGWGISLVNIANRQIKYEAHLRIQKVKEQQDAEKMIPEPVKLDVMSLKRNESF